MSHEELAEVYDLYALDVLDNEAKASLEDHLASGCPQCVAGVHRGFALTMSLAALPDAVEPPRSLRRRVLASVGVEPKTSGLWTGVLALLSAGLLIGIVLLTMERTRQVNQTAQLQDQLRQRSTELTRVRDVLQILNEPETRQVVFGKGQPAPPSGRIFVNAQRGVLLIASHLPPAPAGKTYEMWLVPKAGAPVPAGLFQSDAQGNALFLRNEAINLASTKAVAVTLEQQAGATTPTLPLVLAAALE